MNNAMLNFALCNMSKYDLDHYLRLYKQCSKLV